MQVKLLSTIQPQKNRVINFLFADRRKEKTAKKIREPDILIFDDIEFNALASGGLAPLGAYVDDETGAQLFAVPLVSFMDLLFYNIDLLQASGFDRPPKTREEFIDAAKAVSEAGNGAAGTAVCLNAEDSLALSRDFFSWLWAAGNDLWQGGDAPAIDSRAMINDIFFFGRLLREGAMNSHGFHITGDQKLEEFAEGKIAMMIASTRAIPALREKMGEKFGITDIPGSGLAGRYSAGLTGLYAGINSETKAPGKALSFINYLIEQRPLLCAELKAVPGIVSEAIPGDYVRDDPFYSKAREIFESAVIVQGFLGKKGSDEFENIFREEMIKYFETGRSERETAAVIQNRLDEIFNRESQ